jgi:hypothetical protein
LSLQIKELAFCKSTDEYKERQRLVKKIFQSIPDCCDFLSTKVPVITQSDQQKPLFLKRSFEKLQQHQLTKNLLLDAHPPINTFRTHRLTLHQ